MKTLKKHNEQREEEYWRVQKLLGPHENGIACPKCGEELWDSNSYILSSIPPKKDVHCPECGYKGYRVA